MRTPTTKVVPFATPIWWDKVTFDSEKIAEKCLALEKESPGRVVSNRGGWQSLDINLPVVFPDLMEAMLPTLQNIVLEMGVDITLESAWVNINRKGSFNMPHTHGSSFSAVLYIKASKDTGKIHFENPVETQLYRLYKTFIGSDSGYEWAPETGTFLFFPGYLRHLVMPNNSDEDRISIAMNFAVSGSDNLYATEATR